MYLDLLEGFYFQMLNVHELYIRWNDFAFQDSHFPFYYLLKYTRILLKAKLKQ